MPIRAAVLPLLLLFLRRDLDVGIPPGSPLDFLRVPVTTPRAKRKNVPTPSPGPGVTTTDAEIPRFPQPFAPLSRPLTVDFEGHLRWKPYEQTVGGGTPTEGGLKGYPPACPRDLYNHCAAYFLMQMLHADQVSPREMVSYLIEIGEPASYAASAAKGDPLLSDMADLVIHAVGWIPKSAPSIGGEKIERDIARELSVGFPYQEGFGGDFLKLLQNQSLPALKKLAEKATHTLLRRNAVFALRAYDDESVLPTLRAALKSSDKVVRNRALAALIRWQDTESVPWLIEQLDGADLPFRSYAIYALGRIGDPRAVMPIAERVKRVVSDWELLWAALPALARLRDNRDEVTDLLRKIPKRVASTTAMPEMRRKILQERVRIAFAFLGDAVEQAWMRKAAVLEPNKALVKEWRENELIWELAKLTPKPPAPKPQPAPQPAPSPPPPTSQPDTAALLRQALLEYTGVRSVEVEKDAIRITVETEADAADLRLLFGERIGDVPVVVKVVS